MRGGQQLYLASEVATRNATKQPAGIEVGGHLTLDGGNEQLRGQKRGASISEQSRCRVTLGVSLLILAYVNESKQQV